MAAILNKTWDQQAHVLLIHNQGPSKPNLILIGYR